LVIYSKNGFHLSLFGFHPPKDLLDLTKEELIQVEAHIKYWSDRGPFTQESAGFKEMVELSKDPLLIHYFRNKLAQGKRALEVGIIIQNYVVVLDPSLATAIFKATIPFFPPGWIETNLSAELAPVQTTLSMDDLWVKRRCLVERALGWTPLNSEVPLESIRVECPFREDPQITENIINYWLDEWFSTHSFPKDNWEELADLAALIVFGSTEERPMIELYLRQAQSLPSALGSSEVPFPELKRRYREYLEEVVQKRREDNAWL